MDEDTLAHYGVLGMKWGVRKKQSSSSKTSSKKSKTVKSVKKYYNTRKNYTQKINSRKKNKYKDLTTLSDTELRNRINRMQMERQYSSLLRDQKYAVTVGKNFSDNIVAKSANQTTSQLLKKGMKKAVKLV